MNKILSAPSSSLRLALYMQDVGFDYEGKGGKDNFIIDVYFHHHFPKAVSSSCASPCYSIHHAFYVQQHIARPEGIQQLSHFSEIPL